MHNEPLVTYLHFNRISAN